MDKKKIVLAISAAVSLLIWVRAFTLLSKGKRVVRAGKMPPAVPAQNERQALKTAYPDWKRDPFSLERMLEVQDAGLHLAGIMFDEKASHALINEYVVRLGDTIEGNTVVDIQKDKVILNDGVQNFELRLPE